MKLGGGLRGASLGRKGGGGLLSGSDVFLHLLTQLCGAGGDLQGALVKVHRLGHGGFGFLGKGGFFVGVLGLGGSLKEALAVGFEDVELIGLFLGFLGVFFHLIKELLKRLGSLLELFLGGDEGIELLSGGAVLGAELGGELLKEGRQVCNLRGKNGELDAQALFFFSSEDVGISERLGGSRGGLEEVLTDGVELLGGGRRRLLKCVLKRLDLMRNFFLYLTLEEKSGVAAVTDGFNLGLQGGADDLAEAAGDGLVLLERTVNQVAELEACSAVGGELGAVGGEKVDALTHEEDHDEDQNDDGHAGIGTKELLDDLLGVHSQNGAFAVPD